MKCICKFISISLAIATVVLMGQFVFANGKTLVLNGDFYRLSDGEYILQIENVEQLKALDGKKLGFKIKSEEVKDGKIQNIEEVTEILGVRQETTTGNSDVIFKAIQQMLVKSDDNKVLTFGASGEGYETMVNLLNGELSNKKENIAVEYYDNRVNGDVTTTAKVIYKIGTASSNSASSSRFVFYRGSKTTKEETEVNKVATATNINKKMNVSEILLQLKDENVKIATVKLGKESTTVIPKSLLSELMYDKYKDKEIIFEKFSDNALLFKCIMPVSSISLCEKFDIGITTQNSKVDEVLVGKCNKYKIISFTEKGTLPAICSFYIPVDLKDFDTSQLKFYSVDVEKKSIEKKNMTFELKDGMVIFKTGFGGNYIITDSNI